MSTKKRKEKPSSITGITIYLIPSDLDINSLRCTYSSPTASEQDPKSKIEEHINKYSEAWQELAKR